MNYMCIYIFYLAKWPMPCVDQYAYFLNDACKKWYSISDGIQHDLG